jgi:D-alanyl-lipoteichoic acid acyltransferase DltB (MBOAT superfamily)
MLLVASLFFYGSWDYRFLSLLLISIVLDYYCGIKIHESAGIQRRRFWLACSMIGNLGMLGFFKYCNFFADSLTILLSSLGFRVHPWALAIVLPVGISFYTFQTMSYTIDIYRRQLKPTYDLVNFSLFVSFFPQLVAGPIERARNLIPLFIMNVIQYRSGDLMIFTKQKSWVRFAGYLLSILMILYIYLFTANIGGGEEFIYFQF